MNRTRNYVHHFDLKSQFGRERMISTMSSESVGLLFGARFLGTITILEDEEVNQLVMLLQHLSDAFIPMQGKIRELVKYLEKNLLAGRDEPPSPRKKMSKDHLHLQCKVAKTISKFIHSWFRVS